MNQYILSSGGSVLARPSSPASIVIVRRTSFSIDVIVGTSAGSWVSMRWTPRSCCSLRAAKINFSCMTLSTWGSFSYPYGPSLDPLPVPNKYQAQVWPDDTRSERTIFPVLLAGTLNRRGFRPHARGVGTSAQLKDIMLYLIFCFCDGYFLLLFIHLNLIECNLVQWLTQMLEIWAYPVYSPLHQLEQADVFRDNREYSVEGISCRVEHHLVSEVSPNV